MYFTYIMEIIPATDCDLIPMYCKNESNTEIETNGIHVQYVLTTKTLIHSKDGNPELIPQVSEELKNKIIREFFDIPYVKDKKKQITYDKPSNFRFMTLNISSEDNVENSKRSIKKYIDNKLKDSENFIFCIQGIKKTDIDELDNKQVVSSEDDSSVLILYKNNEKIKFVHDDENDNKLEFSSTYVSHDKVEILSQCFILKDEMNNTSILTVININNDNKSMLDKFVPNIKSVSFRKILKKLILKTILKNRHENDIDILLYDIIISGNFTNTNFKEDVDYVLNEIINNDPLTIKIKDRQSLKNIKGNNYTLDKVKYICDLVDNPSCLVNNDSQMTQKYIQSSGNKGVFVSDSLKVIDTSIKKLDSDNQSNKNTLFQLKAIIDIEDESIDDKHFKNYFLDFSDKKLFMKTNSILLKNEINNLVISDIDYQDLSFKDIYKDYDDKQLFKKDGHSVQTQKNDTEKLNDLFKEMGYNTIEELKRLHSYIKTDILTSEPFSNDILLILQNYYFKEYGYIDINFYKNFKFIIDKKEKKIKLILLNELIYKIEFEYDEVKACISRILDFLLIESRGNKEIASLLQYTFYRLSVLRTYNFEINLKEVYLAYCRENLLIEEDINVLVNKLNFKDTKKLNVLLNNLDKIKHWKEKYTNYAFCQKHTQSFAYTSITINLQYATDSKMTYVLKSELLNENLPLDKLKLDELEENLFFIDRSAYLHSTAMIMYSKIMRNPRKDILKLEEILQKDSIPFLQLCQLLKNFAPIIPFKPTDDILEDDMDDIDKEMLYKLLPEFSRKIFKIIHERFPKYDDFLDEINSECKEYFIINNIDSNILEKCFKIIYSCIIKEKNKNYYYLHKCKREDDKNSQTKFHIRLECTEDEFKKINSDKKKFIENCQKSLFNIFKKSGISKIRKSDIQIIEDSIRRGSVIFTMKLDLPISSEISNKLIKVIKSKERLIQGDSGVSYKLLDISTEYLEQVEENAAIKIQATFRGMINREKTATKIQKKKHNAATQIQATFRGFENRKKAREKKEEKQRKQEKERKKQEKKERKRKKLLSDIKIFITEYQAYVFQNTNEPEEDEYQAVINYGKHLISRLKRLYKGENETKSLTVSDGLIITIRDIKGAITTIIRYAEECLEKYKRAQDEIKRRQLNTEGISPLEPSPEFSPKPKLDTKIQEQLIELAKEPPEEQPKKSVRDTFCCIS